MSVSEKKIVLRDLIEYVFMDTEAEVTDRTLTRKPSYKFLAPSSLGTSNLQNQSKKRTALIPSLDFSSIASFKVASFHPAQPRKF
jgi:hypothetical protein